MTELRLRDPALGIADQQLVQWVRRARMDRGDFADPHKQAALTSDKRAELARLRKKNRGPRVDFC